MLLWSEEGRHFLCVNISIEQEHYNENEEGCQTHKYLLSSISTVEGTSLFWDSLGINKNEWFPLPPGSLLHMSKQLKRLHKHCIKLLPEFAILHMLGLIKSCWTQWSISSLTESWVAATVIWLPWSFSHINSVAVGVTTFQTSNKLDTFPSTTIFAYAKEVHSQKEWLDRNCPSVPKNMWY